MSRYSDTIETSLSLPRYLQGNEVVILHHQNMPPRLLGAGYYMSVSDVRRTTKVLWYDGDSYQRFVNMNDGVSIDARSFD